MWRALLRLPAGLEDFPADGHLVVNGPLLHKFAVPNQMVGNSGDDGPHPGGGTIDSDALMGSENGPAGGAAVLVPVSGGATSGSVSTSGNTEGEIDTTIGGTQVKKAFKREGNNAPVAVNCSGAMDGYACTYTLTGDITQMDYLVFTNPYNDREVSIEVTALTGGGAASFTNVQVEVDSTGRASNYYRRIQTRLTMADPDVPVPTYALNLGGGDGPLSKKFAVTRNCWLVDKNNLDSCKNGKSI